MQGNEYILVIIDAFSRWVELFPTKSTTAVETALVILNHIGRFVSPRQHTLLVVAQESQLQSDHYKVVDKCYIHLQWVVATS